MANHLLVSLKILLFKKKTIFAGNQKNSSVRWQKNGNDYKYMNFGRKRVALTCPLYSHSALLKKMIEKKGLKNYMERVKSSAFYTTGKFEF